MKKQNCHVISRQLEHWFELTDQEKQVARAHAQDCRSCRSALASTDRVLKVLDRSTAAYDRMTYAAPLPTLPARRPARIRFFAPVPALGGAVAVAVMVLLLIWYGPNRPQNANVAQRPSMVRYLRMPTMPTVSGKVSVSLNPGTLNQRISRFERRIGPVRRRHLKMPSRPSRPNPDLKRETSMRATRRT